MSEKGAYIEACEVTTDEAMKTARDGIAIHIVNDLIAANEELKAKLEIAIKALEFYGTYANWSSTSENHIDKICSEDIEHVRTHICGIRWIKDYGGNIARQALKEIKEL